ncbi:MAG: hypothetical protein HXY41_06230 [Chloroflexi bacterium]|nr:hypothetical protein [Chloroflexota bacterium]
MRGRIEYRSLFWPLVLIGVGVVWLLANLGVLSAASISVLFRLWPLILIIIGLDLLFGRQSPLLGGLIGIGAVALIILLMLVGPSLGWSADVEVKAARFEAPRGDAASARVDVTAGVGDVKVNALTDSNNLFEANIRYVGEVEFKDEGEADKFISLSQHVENLDFDFGILDFLFNHENDQLIWNVGLSPDVPLDLSITTGTGSANLALESLQVADLTVNAGTGSVDVSLPNMDESYRVEISVGTGSGIIRIPDGTALELHATSGTGGFTFDVPDDAAVRLVGSTGTGGITVPASFLQVGGDTDNFVGENGTWETAGFDSAVRQIIIRFEGGTGSLTVR